MDGIEIKKHIRNHYRLLYEGGHPCRVPIQTGRSLARSLGYPVELLDFIPEDYWKRFVPCGNPIPFLVPSAGDRVLNLGCGAGIDTYTLLLKYGASIRIVSLDVVAGVLHDASALAHAMPMPSNVPLASSFSVSSASHRTYKTQITQRSPGAELQWVCGDGEHLPFQAGSFDWIIMNGVFNLFPDKPSILEEIERVLKPSGSLVGTDLCCTASLPDYFEEEPDAWAWCMSGACTEGSMSDLFLKTGFRQVRLVPQEEREEEDMFYRIAFTCKKEAD